MQACSGKLEFVFKIGAIKSGLIAIQGWTVVLRGNGLDIGARRQKLAKWR